MHARQLCLQPPGHPLSTCSCVCPHPLLKCRCWSICSSTTTAACRQAVWPAGWDEWYPSAIAPALPWVHAAALTQQRCGLRQCRQPTCTSAQSRRSACCCHSRNPTRSSRRWWFRCGINRTPCVESNGCLTVLRSLPVACSTGAGNGSGCGGRAGRGSQACLPQRVLVPALLPQKLKDTAFKALLAAIKSLDTWAGPIKSAAAAVALDSDGTAGAGGAGDARGGRQGLVVLPPLLLLPQPTLRRPVARCLCLASLVQEARAAARARLRRRATERYVSRCSSCGRCAWGGCGQGAPVVIKLW